MTDIKRATSNLGVGKDELLGPGDFLVVRTNGSKDLIGRAACVEAKGAGSFFASYLIRFRLLGDEVLWRWVSACWRSQWIRGRIESTATTSAGQYNISLTELAQFAIPVPAVQEQVALVGLLTVALERLERLDANVAEQQRLAAMADQSILAKAFRGELVPQDPSDEPASVLLERIRTARDSAEAGGARRRPRKVEEVVEEPEEVDDDGGGDAPSPPLRPTPGRHATKDISELDQEEVHDEVFAALWARGALEKDDAVRHLAEHLREAGHVEFQRLRADGPLYAQCLQFIEAAVKAGRLDRPKRGQVRACKADATTFTADDWRLALVSSIGTEPVDRDDAIRMAAEWAQVKLGLEFARLRSDGHIVQGLRSAINSAIRRGDVTRHDAKRILRAQTDAPSPVKSATPTAYRVSLAMMDGDFVLHQMGKFFCVDGKIVVPSANASNWMIAELREGIVGPDNERLTFDDGEKFINNISFAWQKWNRLCTIAPASPDEVAGVLGDEDRDSSQDEVVGK